jgi:hypothetical protein
VIFLWLYKLSENTFLTIDQAYNIACTIAAGEAYTTALTAKAAIGGKNAVEGSK